VVKEFYYQPQCLAVHDGLGQFDEGEFSDSEKEEPGFQEEFAEWRQGWISDGLFLLSWGRDYRMSPDGYIVPG
jgi:hypothetical protein